MVARNGFLTKFHIEMMIQNLAHSFDAENCRLSIGEVFRAIPALCREVGANMCHQNFKNPVIFGPFPLTELWRIWDLVPPTQL